MATFAAEELSAIETFKAGGLSLLISITLSAPSWGIATAQTIQYFGTYHHDHPYLKGFIGFCFLIDSVQFILVARYMYLWLVHWRLPQNYALALSSTPSVVPLLYIHCTLLLLVQCFYGIRVWHVSGRKFILAGTIILFSIAQFASGIVAGGYVTAMKSLDSVYSPFIHVTQILSNASAILSDLITCVSLVYFLHRRGRDTFPSTRNVVWKLILYSLNIGIAAMLASVLGLVTWQAVSPTSFTWAIFYCPVGGLYLNGALVSLNARFKLRRHLDPTTRITTMSSTPIFDIDGVSTMERDIDITMDRIESSRKPPHTEQHPPFLGTPRAT